MRLITIWVGGGKWKLSYSLTNSNTMCEDIQKAKESFNSFSFDSTSFNKSYKKCKDLYNRDHLNIYFSEYDDLLKENTVTSAIFSSHILRYKLLDSIIINMKTDANF